MRYNDNDNISTNMRKKLNDFHFQIRRKIVEQQRSQIRKSLVSRYNSQMIKVPNLILLFNITEQQQNSLRKDNQTTEKFQLIEILILRSQYLTKLPFIKKQKMMDQNNFKQLINQGNQFSKQKSSLYNLDLQASLYEEIAKDIDADYKRYKKVPKKYQRYVQDFIANFLTKNSYIEVSKSSNLQICFLNFLQYFLSVISFPDLQKQILYWVKGTQALPLIENCLDGSFLSVSEYGHIYDIILIVLKGQNDYSQKKYDSIDVLLKCIRLADYDDIQTLLVQKSLIITQIILFLIRVCVPQNKNYEKNFLTAVRRAILCLTLMLQTYDELIIKSAYEGAGYIGAKLIISGYQQWVKGGLIIWQRLVNVSQENNEEVHKYLLDDNEINQTFIWEQIGSKLDIPKNPVYSKLFLNFLHSFISIGRIDQIEKLGERLQYSQNYNLIDLLIDYFCESTDPIMLQNSLGCIETFLYYSSKFDENDQSNSGVDIEQNQLYLKLCDHKFLSGLNSINDKLILQNTEEKGVTQMLKQKANRIKEYLKQHGKIQNQI